MKLHHENYVWKVTHFKYHTELVGVLFLFCLLATADALSKHKTPGSKFYASFGSGDTGDAMFQCLMWIYWNESEKAVLQVIPPTYLQAD